ncbi:cation diffusion facilitator family transporter [Saccharibacter sp. 17.LH.SD]|uniref:cation diffusion facilitator family transporter n=1 Tax=Saccharibacter sp. 17.LH.SD TaxID=2689393 RepID=UPI001371FCEE|nr:cation diffusion facilitator family transporter [Saccharibacter sp. 17.LH.SD]MXV43877.1 cation diffusion facilitator family transporter [Saccharibacter sp. 17.LH.SD]
MPIPVDHHHSSLRLRIARLSIVVSIVVLAIKYAAYAVSGSGALLSDAIETILNVIASIGTLWAVSFAARPADENHPYGHGKAEYFWAVIEGILVVLTAIGILLIAVQDAFHPKSIDAPLRGVALNAFAGIINFIWARIMITAGKKQKSQALLSAGEHVQSDVWASLALLIGVALIPVLHWSGLDPLLSALVALNVLWTGFGMMRESMSGLMDEAPSPELVDRTRALIAQNGHGALEAHDLRMRKVGALFFVEFHLVVPDTMQITEAHDICDHIESAIRRHIGSTSIHIHVEPENMAKRHEPGQNGVLVLSTAHS